MLKCAVCLCAAELAQNLAPGADRAGGGAKESSILRPKGHIVDASVGKDGVAVATARKWERHAADQADALRDGGLGSLFGGDDDDEAAFTAFGFGRK